MKKPELIVHIGMGKTGTSSIQRTLKENKKELKKVGIKYLGYDLDYCKGPKLTEQCFKPGLKDDKNHEILTEILLKTLQSHQNNYSKLIVSNERLFQRDQYASLFKRIVNEGYRVTIITYLRRPDLWARSAHAQWGIKHKTAEGNVKTFNEWAIDRKLFYSRHLKVWQAAFPENFIIRNYEEINDVVADFFGIMGSNYNKAVTANETVNNEQLILWGIYNSMFNESALPNRFNGFMESVNLPKTPELDINNLLPSQHDLSTKHELCKGEIHTLNQILSKYGEPKFHENSPTLKNETIDNLKLIQYLTEIIYNMDARIKKLESNTTKGKIKSLFEG